jgi:hypothetical protein
MLHIPVFMLRSVLPNSEYHKWLAFMQYKEADTQEIQMAVLSSIVSNALGGKAKVKDFLINKPEERIEQRRLKTRGMSDSQVSAVFSGIAKKMI